MESTRTFVLFSLEHLLTLLVRIVLGVVVVYGPKRFMSRESIDKAAKLTGIVFLIYVFGNRLDRIIFHGASIVDLLPLHMCRFSTILCSFVLINRSKTLFDIVYYIGLIGGGMTLLTPDTRSVFPQLNYIRYIFEHWYILAAIGYLIVNCDMRPTKRSLMISIFYGNALMLMAGVANAAWGTNFLFICEKPRGTTLMDIMGPWPYYLIWLEIVGIGLFSFLYAPFFIYDHAAQPAENACERA